SAVGVLAAFQEVWGELAELGSRARIAYEPSPALGQVTEHLCEYALSVVSRRKTAARVAPTSLVPPDFPCPVRGLVERAPPPLPPLPTLGHCDSPSSLG